MEEASIPDERLKLMFTCCHRCPSASDAQVALYIAYAGRSLYCSIASAFLVPLPTMAQRLVRAKGRFATLEFRIACQKQHVLGERVDAVLCVLYLIFNEGIWP